MKNFQALAAVPAALLSTAAMAQSLLPNETMSTLAVHAIADAHPVLGSDDKIHLAYELVVTNPSPLFVTLDKVEALDAAGTALETLAGAGLTLMTTR